MRTRLDELAVIIRSKNAGPCMLTFDLIFDDSAKFDFVCGKLKELRRECAQRLAISEEIIRIYQYPPAGAIKITVPRDCVAGDPNDRDVYGAQQHAPLLGLSL